ncbi:MAG: hypothetical protein ACD_79C00911G0003 [uncultured bacterium]|nr:MAG: hypothetical protein ACD_79C00911G0003 [uncultured bacterium]
MKNLLLFLFIGGILMTNSLNAEDFDFVGKAAPNVKGINQDSEEIDFETI